MLHFIAYHREPSWGDFDRFLTNPNDYAHWSKNISDLERSINQTVWIVSGNQIDGKMRHHLRGTFTPTKIEVGEDSGHTAHGIAKFIHGTKSITDQAWFSRLNLRRGFREIKDSEVVHGLKLIQATAMRLSSDLEKSADRSIQTTYERIIRDTAMTRRVKEMYEFQCQICMLALPLGADRVYAEAHHIKPLGRPHNGPDKTENIICVCPNHHAQLDYGGIKLVLEELKLKKHNISAKYIDYHNSQIYRS